MNESSIVVLTKMFYEPSNAFGSIQQNARPWLPLLTLPILSAAILYWYYATVDFPWLVEYTLNANPDMKAAERQVVERIFTKDFLMWGSVMFALISTPLLSALYALYLSIVTKIIGSTISFGKWFSFALWTTTPALIALPLMALQIVSSQGRVSVDALNMLSLHFLFAQWIPSHGWESLLDMLSLNTFWTVFLSYVGLRVWIGRSAITCLLLSLLPYLLVYGGWALKIVLFS